MSRMPRVAVAGGSLGGLTAALVLRDAGCDVRVFERSSAALQARGAGIAALDTTLRYLVDAGRVPGHDVCSATGWIRFLNRDGSLRHEQRHRYRFSSWNTIYRSLLRAARRRAVPAGHGGDGVRRAARHGQVTLGPGEHASQRVECDLLVCADGLELGRPGARCCPRPAGLLRVRRLARHRARAGPVARHPPGSTTRSPTRCCPAATSSSIRSPPWTARSTEGDRLINIVWYVNVAGARAGPRS